MGCALPLSAQALTPPTTLEGAVDQFKSLKETANKRQTSTASAKKMRTVGSIDIDGNKSIPDSLIQQEIFLRVGDSYNQFKLNRAVQQINSLGVFSAVTVDTIQRKQGDRIVFTVTEAPKIGRVDFPGVKAVSENVLSEMVSIKAGDHLNLRALRRDILKLEKYYEEEGYYQVKVRSVETPEADGEPLVFYIREGVINSISVTGNTKTKDYVLTREMTLKPGDVLRTQDLREDLRRIYNLNYFTELNPAIIPSGDAYNLDLHVVERGSNGQLSFGGGFSPQSGFSLFTDLYWDNLAGTGQLILLKGQFGVGGDSARNSTFQFKYHNPWMWDNRRSFTFKTWLTDGDQLLNPLSSGSRTFLDEKRFGLETIFGIPSSYDFRTVHKLKHEEIELTDQNYKYQINSYSFGFIYDTRDVVFNPTSGHYSSIFIEKGLEVNGQSINLTQVDVSLKQFIKTFDRQTLALRADVGYINMDALPIEDQFLYFGYRVGYSDTVRGYDDDRVIFGSKRIVLGAEYRFLFNDTFTFVVFVDAGVASSNKLSDLPDFLVGKGVGVRFTVPGLGPLRFDAGLDDAGEMRIQFNMGHSF